MVADTPYVGTEAAGALAEQVKKRLLVADTMPASPAGGQVVLYAGATTASFTQGGIYLYKLVEGSDPAEYEWVLISQAEVDLSQYKKIFIGTTAEWNALTTAEKTEFDECNLTDDLAGGELIVSDEVTSGDLNPVTSNAVANYALAKSGLIPSASKFLMSNMEDQGYPAIDGTTVYANNAGRIDCRNGVRVVANPTIGRQWPVTSDSTKDEFVALGGLQFYLDKTNNKLWVRFANSVDMSAWKEL